jgi:hypothetical protein
VKSDALRTVDVRGPKPAKITIDPKTGFPLVDGKSVLEPRGGDDTIMVRGRLITSRMTAAIAQSSSTESVPSRGTRVISGQGPQSRRQSRASGPPRGEEGHQGGVQLRDEAAEASRMTAAIAQSSSTESVPSRGTRVISGRDSPNSSADAPPARRARPQAGQDYDRSQDGIPARRWQECA